MNDRLSLTVVVYIELEATRTRCLATLRELAASGTPGGQVPWKSLTIQEATEDVLEACLLKGCDLSEGRAVLLLSDKLAEAVGHAPNERYMLSTVAKLVRDVCRDQLLGTVAIVERYQRVPDIDRVVRRSFEKAEFVEAVVLTAEKIDYVRTPRRQRPSDPILIRALASEAEMMEYFKLRHRIYRIMGYLDQKAEFARSGMEINECDPNAIHIGAFAQSGPNKGKLIGTARLVGLERLDEQAARWTANLARSDPILRSKLKYPMALGLPVFQSMYDSMKTRAGGYVDLLTREKCGELSRVIVEPAFRGGGIAGALVHFTLLKAFNLGINWFFLECLPVHETIYQKLGFRRIEGMEGEVINVKKTMIAMEMNPTATEALCQETPMRRLMELIRDQGLLCLCQYEGSFQDHYECGWNQACPRR